jgi:hypothetical protein
MVKLPNRGLGIESLFDWAKEIVAIAILGGTVIKDVSVTTSGVSVNHGLGRVPQGAIVIKSDSADSFQVDNFTKTTFDITSGSGAAITSIWVF